MPKQWGKLKTLPSSKLMKQHITKEQWSELSNKEAEKLLIWETTNIPARELDKYPNIGQMIEFLGDDWWENKFITYEGNKDILPFNNELCDALWEAVKYKLNI